MPTRDQYFPAIADIAALEKTGSARKVVSHPHAGNITAAESYGFCMQHKAAIIDVRTDAEWKFVGVPLLEKSSATLHKLSWMLFPDYQLNEQFLPQLTQLVQDKQMPLLFLCKIGGRSLHAAHAAAQAGYSQSYNILAGFEGEHNAQGQRGQVNGWKAEGCPWTQS